VTDNDFSLEYAVPAGAAADRALVDEALAGLKRGFEQWEDLLAEQEVVEFTADLGDIYAECNADGHLSDLRLAPTVMSQYTHFELMARLNRVFESLREAVRAEYQAKYGRGHIE
jgi:hypothetical protein